MRRSLTFNLMLGFGLTLLLLVTALKVGALALTWEEVWGGLLAIAQGDWQNRNAVIIAELRFPRALMAWLVGGALALGGTSIQGLLRNPLAAPSLIGISTGAAFFAALAIVLPLPWILRDFVQPIWFMPLAAFVGSLLTSLAVFRLATFQQKADTALMLLAGVAINSLCGAGTGLMTFVANDAELRNITFWSLGSVADSDWQKIGMLVLCIIPALLVCLRMGRSLNAWMLGETEARLMGIPVEKQKWLLLSVTALSVGCAVAFTGVIGFVGLVVPHLLRFTLGSDHTKILPASFVWGGVLLLAADLIARSAVSPLELPIGIVTAGIGAPYFLYLLRDQKRKGALP